MSGPDFIEIATDDHAAAREFWGGLFDWTWTPMGEGPGGYFADGDRRVGLHDGDSPCVVPYIAVDDIDAMARKVTELGGAVMGGIEGAGELGRFATCTDPSGARFGLHQR